jgi:hypothetical protein
MKNLRAIRQFYWKNGLRPQWASHFSDIAIAAAGLGAPAKSVVFLPAAWVQGACGAQTAVRTNAARTAQV